MRRLTLALLGLLAVASCATGRSQADQDRDAAMLASALHVAVVQGLTFDMTQELVLTGGQIPSGQEEDLRATVTGGELAGSAAKFSYHIAQGKQSATYDMLTADGRLFVKQHGATAWKVTPLASATALFPALRLDLARETVLLAAAVSSAGVSHIAAGFAQKYAVRPAPDQLEELESIPIAGAAEDQFLKTATAEVDVFVLVPGGHLGRVEVHVRGTDPSDGTTQQIQSAIDVRPARVAAIQAPSQAQAVAPSDILS